MKFGYINKSKFSYCTDKNGNYLVNGKMKHKALQKYDVIGLKVIDKFEIHIAKFKTYDNEIMVSSDNVHIYKTFNCKDIFTNQIICEGEFQYYNLGYHSKKYILGDIIGTRYDEPIKLITMDNINNYLMYFDFVKAEYNVEDIKLLLNNIKDNFECPEIDGKIKNLIKKDK